MYTVHEWKKNYKNIYVYHEFIIWSSTLILLMIICVVVNLTKKIFKVLVQILLYI